MKEIRDWVDKKLHHVAREKVILCAINESGGGLDQSCIIFWLMIQNKNILHTGFQLSEF